MTIATCTADGLLIPPIERRSPVLRLLDHDVTKARQLQRLIAATVCRFEQSALIRITAAPDPGSSCTPGLGARMRSVTMFESQIDAAEFAVDLIQHPSILLCSAAS